MTGYQTVLRAKIEAEIAVTVIHRHIAPSNREKVLAEINRTGVHIHPDGSLRNGVPVETPA